MVKDFEKNFFHGINGFGDVNFPTTPDSNLIRTENAVSYMHRIVKEVRVEQLFC